MSYVFDLDSLVATLPEDSARFRAAEPFPHLAQDGFLRGDAARELARVFPDADDNLVWDRFGAHGFEVKRGSSDEAHFPVALRNAVHDLNAGPFVRYLEALTGIEHLLPDPHLVGGGLHLSRQGDHLGIHADFNWHEGLRAHRRLNLLIYLTPHAWQADWGGALELWQTDASAHVVTIAPEFNRAVLFATRSDTFHGHPAPWAAPAGIHRQSIALYYYTTERPDEEIRPAHSTLYKGYHVK
ncbi:MAG TPA: 2OG-Fe(II) oxygenase [Rhodanobacteraceae bacterium]|nr:2OG-Fe(II) oxygenase [Rhodanobacteraceae bacterium]